MVGALRKEIELSAQIPNLVDRPLRVLAGRKHPPPGLNPPIHRADPASRRPCLASPLAFLALDFQQQRNPVGHSHDEIRKKAWVTPGYS
jgi:hypothetical protein